MKFLLALIVSLYFVACSNSESFTPPVDETAVLPIVDTTEDSTQEIEGMLAKLEDENDRMIEKLEMPALGTTPPPAQIPTTQTGDQNEQRTQTAN